MQGRSGQIIVPHLHGVTLNLLEFSGTEFVNDINLFRVKAMVEYGALNLDEVLGMPMTVKFEADFGTRFFRQTVFSARFLGEDNGQYFYEFELRPWIWAMSRRETSRIFTDMTLEEIFAKVLGEYGGLNDGAHKFVMSRPMPKRDYVVQYRETDLNFLRRWLEECGLNFHIDMGEHKQTFVISDGTDAFAKVPGEDRRYVPSTGLNQDDAEQFKSWVPQRMLTTGAVRLKDFDFLLPSQVMEITQKNEKSYNISHLESYDYPGRYTGETNDKQRFARRRLDAFRMSDRSVRAEGGLLGLGAGMRFNLIEHPDDAENIWHVCLSAHHHFVDGGYRSGARDVATYDGYYSVIAESIDIAPERVTPRAMVRGPQTAIVAPGKEPIDKHGRITVKFHWDETGKSMPCRVSQMWAGPKWGTLFIPRVGMEVIVEFLEGDPDKPMIMGCVYNAENQPPYTLPADIETSGVKTRSFGSGDEKDYNELIFDDKKGKEKIRVHGRKDLEVTIEDTETRKILKKQDIEVKGERIVTVKGTETTNVTKKLSISSDTEIVLKVGSSSITLLPSEIKIDSPTIKINAGVQLETHSGASAKHTSSAPMQIQAPMVKIN